MTATAHITSRELDSRSGDGLDIRLLWNAADGSIVVTVDDARTEEAFVIQVAATDALDAFRHPFAYAAAPPRQAVAVGG